MFEYDPTRHYPKETESRVVIRFQDCAPLQHKELKTLLWSIMRYVNMSNGKSTDHQGAIVDFLKATLEGTDITQVSIKDRTREIRLKLQS